MPIPCAASNAVPAELKGFTFVYASDWGSEERVLCLEGVEWF